MRNSHPIQRAATALVTLGLAWTLTGCAAGMENQELAQLRATDDSLGQRIDALSARTDRLERALDQLRQDYDVAIERWRGMLRFNVPVHFGFDDATIRETDKPLLDRFANVVKEFYPDALITVEGFADPAGPMGYNLTLGQDRAEAVKRYLARTRGLEADRIRTISYGEASTRQVRPGEQGPGLKGLENRRVAFVIDYAGTAETGARVTAGF